MSSATLFWYDYESFGTDPQRDKPSQFAGVRTDLSFDIVDEPVTFYCKPSDDCLPQPEACLITGITPQKASALGVCEAEFTRLIHEQLSSPNTCTLGYNNIRFDDELTRNLFYRNFYDPYAREWQNDNSRWDLLDIVRATCALRPDGIEWPLSEEQIPSFRLESLCSANGIEHVNAHDALADVFATIGLARLIRERQPRLFDFFFTHRTKYQAQKLLRLGDFQPVVHVSGMFGADRYCTAVVLPLCQHPQNSNGVVVYDLSKPPDELLELSAEHIRQRLFTRQDQLPEGITRVPLKTVHLNKCPVLAPISVLRECDAQRLNIDLSACQQHIRQIQKAPIITEKIAQVFNEEFAQTNSDPDLMIYSGGFFSRHDKQLMDRIRATPVENLAGLALNFQDNRLPEMLFRYRARNYPHTLNSSEQRRWHQHCKTVMTHPDVGSALTLQQFQEQVEQLQQSDSQHGPLLVELLQFAKTNANQFGLTLIH